MHHARPDAAQTPSTTDETRALVERYFETLADGDPARIAAMFAEQVDWYIPGNEEIAPWLGRRGNPREIAEFFEQLLHNARMVRFDLHKLLVEDDFAVAVGTFASVMQRTGRLFESEFAVQITVRDGLIVRYRLLEEGHGLVVALTP